MIVPRYPPTGSHDDNDRLSRLPDLDINADIDTKKLSTRRIRQSSRVASVVEFLRQHRDGPSGCLAGIDRPCVRPLLCEELTTLVTFLGL